MYTIFHTKSGGINDPDGIKKQTSECAHNLEDPKAEESSVQASRTCHINQLLTICFIIETMFDNTTFKLMAMGNTYPYNEIRTTRQGFITTWLLVESHQPTSIRFKPGTKHTMHDSCHHI